MRCGRAFFAGAEATTNAVEVQGWQAHYYYKVREHFTDASLRCRVLRGMCRVRLLKALTEMCLVFKDSVLIVRSEAKRSLEPPSLGGPAVRPAQTARGQRVTVRHTARAASSARLVQPSQPLSAAVCRACHVHASTGAPNPTWSPRALTTSREAADQAPRSPSEADLRGAEARGLSYYLYLGSETFSTGHGGLRWPRGTDVGRTHVDSLGPAL